MSGGGRAKHWVDQFWWGLGVLAQCFSPTVRPNASRWQNRENGGDRPNIQGLQRHKHVAIEVFRIVVVHKMVDFFIGF